MIDENLNFFHLLLAKKNNRLHIVFQVTDNLIKSGLNVCLMLVVNYLFLSVYGHGSWQIPYSFRTKEKRTIILLPLCYETRSKRSSVSFPRIAMCHWEIHCWNISSYTVKVCLPKSACQILPAWYVIAINQLCLNIPAFATYPIFWWFKKHIFLNESVESVPLYFICFANTVINQQGMQC